MEMDERFRDCEIIQFVCLGDITKFAEYQTCFPSGALENFLCPVFSKTQRLRNEIAIFHADENYRNISPRKMLEMLNENKDILRILITCSPLFFPSLLLQRMLTEAFLA